MKLTALTSFLGIFPIYLAFAAPQSITLWQFQDGTDTISTSTENEVLIPIGTAGAETTYVVNGAVTTTVTQPSTTQATTIQSTAVATIVASASGWRADNADFLGEPIKIDCHLTAANAGECVFAETGTPGSALGTMTGSAVPVVLPVSAAAEASGGSGGGGNGTSSGSQPNQSQPSGALAMSGDVGSFGLLVVAGILGGALTVM